MDKTSGFLTTDGLQTISSQATTLEYVTPWVELAETAIRNDGELTPADWASAIGSTLSTAVSTPGGGADALFGSLPPAGRRLTTNLLVGGALSQFDGDSGSSFIESTVGNEVGQFIGEIGSSLDNVLFNAEQKRQTAQDELGLFIAEQQRLAQGLEPMPIPGSAVLHDEDIAQTTAITQQTSVQGALANGPNAGKQTEFSSREVEQGDNFWGIAKGQLPPDASNEDIQRQTQILMELNPGIDPRNLQVGQNLTLVQPDSGFEVSPETLVAYRQSDAEFQEFLAEKARVERIGQAITTALNDPNAIRVSDSDPRSFREVLADETGIPLNDIRNVSTGATVTNTGSNLSQDEALANLLNFLDASLSTGLFDFNSGSGGGINEQALAVIADAGFDISNLRLSTHFDSDTGDSTIGIGLGDNLLALTESRGGNLIFPYC